MVKNPYARTWTLGTIDRNQEYILYFDAVMKRWEIRTLQDGEYVQTRAMMKRPGRVSERPQRAEPGTRRGADPRSTLVPYDSQASLTEKTAGDIGDHRQQAGATPPASVKGGPAHAGTYLLDVLTAPPVSSRLL